MSSDIQPVIPPYFNGVIYNQDQWTSTQNTTTITISYLNANYLKRTGVATSNAIVTTFAGTTPSTSSSTGTIVITSSGGLGVGGNVYVGGDLSIGGDFIFSGSLDLVGAVTITYAGNALTLNSGAGSTATTLVFQDNSITKWAISKNTSNNLVIIDTANSFSATTLTPTSTGGFTIHYTTDSTNSTTGALIVSGGIGVAKSIHTASNIVLTTAGKYVQWQDGSQQTTAMNTLTASQNYTNASITTDSRGVISAISSGTPATSAYIAEYFTNSTTDEYKFFQVNFYGSNYALNDMLVFRISINYSWTLSGSIYTNTSNFSGDLLVFPRRCTGSNTTSTKQCRLSDNAINGNTSFNRTQATYSPDGRFFWLMPSAGTGTTATFNSTTNNVFVLNALSQQYIAFQIMNPAYPSACSMTFTLALLNAISAPSGIDIETIGFTTNFTFSPP